MATNAQLFAAKLEDPAFRAAFEAAPAAERQKLLDKAGLHIALKDAEAILDELSGSINEEDLKKAAGGGYGFIRPKPDDAPYK